MKKRILLTIFIFVAVILLFRWQSFCHQDKRIFNDVSRLNPVHVQEIIQVHSTQDIQTALEEAKEKGLKISIAGKRHSQGEQQSCPGCLVLDMLDYDKVLSLNQQTKVIRVQSGITWEKIQNYIQPYHLAIEVMQASNVFTVGGSFSVNVHGGDNNYGSIIETVRSFRLLLPSGNIINVSRTEHPELFGLVIGGYGLFGVILDVDLDLTDDVVYNEQSQVMNYKDYPKYFREKILGNPSIGLCTAKLSNAPSSFMTEAVPTTDIKVPGKFNDSIFVLQQEKDIIRNKFFFGLSRLNGWGKDLRWHLQNQLIAKVNQSDFVSRNNAMRPIIKFLDYYSPWDTDILQEYFVPMSRYVDFIDGARKIFLEEHVNLLSITIRYVPQDKEAFLNYARQDSFAFVMYFNQKLSSEGRKKAQQWTRRLVDLAIQLHGTYYLPYQLYPTSEQLRRSYPQIDEFFAKKKAYDPQGLFINGFYKHYSRG